MRRLSGAFVLACTVVLAGCVVQPAEWDEGMASGSYEEVADAPEEITEPPPPLPVYEQPPCPEPGYLWTPGVWQWGPAGYCWVPGTWVAPPEPGLFWTPGYWGLAAGVYVFHAGYWGPRVGFYGGIDYGFGYGGEGYAGGRWVGARFEYNTAVTNVNVNIIHNTYRETIIQNGSVDGERSGRVSYAGGPGTRAAPNAGELAAAREAHFPPTGEQVQHQMMARARPELVARSNEGRPAIAATARPRDFGGGSVVAARAVGAPYRPTVPPVARQPRYNPYVHAGDAPTRQANGVWGTGASADAQTYAVRRNELLARQEQERQALARQQQQEHENFVRQPVHDHSAYESLERQHWQQTSRLVQQHQQQYREFVRSTPPRADRNPRR